MDKLTDFFLFSLAMMIVFPILTGILFHDPSSGGIAGLLLFLIAVVRIIIYENKDGNSHL